MASHPAACVRSHLLHWREAISEGSTQATEAVSAGQPCGIHGAHPMLYTIKDWAARNFSPLYKNVEQDGIVLC